MRSGNHCICEELIRPVEKRNWIIFDRKCNHPGFVEHNHTPLHVIHPEIFSLILCRSCGFSWETKAYYANKIKSLK